MLWNLVIQNDIQQKFCFLETNYVLLKIKFSGVFKSRNVPVTNSLSSLWVIQFGVFPSLLSF